MRQLLTKLQLHHLCPAHLLLLTFVEFMSLDRKILLLFQLFSVLLCYVLRDCDYLKMTWQQSLLSPWQSLSGYKYPALYQLLFSPSSLPWFRIPGRGQSGSCLHPRVGEAALSLPIWHERAEPWTQPYVSFHIQNVQSRHFSSQSPGRQPWWGGVCGPFPGRHKQEILPFLGSRLPGEEESEHVFLCGWCDSGVHQELSPHGQSEEQRANQVSHWPT